MLTVRKVCVPNTALELAAQYANNNVLWYGDDGVCVDFKEPSFQEVPVAFAGLGSFQYFRRYAFSCMADTAAVGGPSYFPHPTSRLVEILGEILGVTTAMTQNAFCIIRRQRHAFCTGFMVGGSYSVTCVRRSCGQ